MRKIIAALNMTLDGICDHTAGIPDKDIHQHYIELLRNGDVILYGRTTFQLMEYWRTLLENPSQDRIMNDFATAIDNIHKIVFSNTLTELSWESASLASRDLEHEVIDLKQTTGKDIYVGSRSLIIQLINLNLVDELQLCIYPMVEGKGLRLFEEIKERKIFSLVNSKVFAGGAIVLTYALKNE